ncbi:MAG: lamin tail domain-containing protein [Dysgonamonadaceae bacterium]|jgi:hypothetical protein|nr:lamin tail domain-containing protein [Dysgonamonadaceae bacterium]
MKKFFVLALVLAPISLFAQVSDNFNDGLFHSEPPQIRQVEWTGDVGKFIVNESFQLQSNADATGDDTAQLRTESTLADNAYWECWLEMDFNPSANNYARIYLVSDTEDLTSKELNGLFIRVGHTDKNICLMKSQAGKNNTTLIKGTSNRLNNATNSLTLKATLNKLDVFSLYSKLENENDYTLEGSCSLKETFTSQYFGLSCYYSKTRSKNFYFDDFIVRELRDDEQGNSEPPTDLTAGDALLSEIMFNPPTGGDEWVEIYNASDKMIDLKDLSIATRKASDGSLNKAYPLATESTPFQSGEYLVVTKSRENICPYFTCQEGTLYAELAIFPALANESSIIVILNNITGDVIDEVPYDADWHTAGISNTKGISLERSDFDKPSDDASNWHSASADIGFATPGYQNSNRTSIDNINETEEFTVIYPLSDLDSYIIRYRFNKSGFRCHARLYSSSGRLAAVIAENKLLGTEGEIMWNGKGSGDLPLSSGIYILFLETFDSTGTAKKFKKPVVVK